MGKDDRVMEKCDEQKERGVGKKKVVVFFSRRHSLSRIWQIACLSLFFDSGNDEKNIFGNPPLALQKHYLIIFILRNERHCRKN